MKTMSTSWKLKAAVCVEHSGFERIQEKGKDVAQWESAWLPNTHKVLGWSLTWGWVGGGMNVKESKKQKLDTVFYSLFVPPLPHLNL